MFTDMVKKIPELKDFIKALGRPLRVATMCSGTESPLLALDKIGAATEATYGAKLSVDHVFSCEIEPFKQAYIERNFAPPILFRDIRELDEDQATTAYGALVDVPGHCDILVAGTSCVDYSNLNNEQKKIQEQGESGQTFRGMMTWVEKKHPPVVILENVCGAPWEEIAEDFQSRGYAAHYMRVDTKRYYIPHTRTRVYLFAAWVEPVKGEKGPEPAFPGCEKYRARVDALMLDAKAWQRQKGKKEVGVSKEWAKAQGLGWDEKSGKLAAVKGEKAPRPLFPGCDAYQARVKEMSGAVDKKSRQYTAGTLCDEWKRRVKALERPASATLEAFLFDSDDPRVHKGRQMLALPGEDNTRAGTDWARCESRHQRARLEEGLGTRRPFTNWEGGCSMPDYAWNDWGKAQTDRVLDLMDIDYLRLAQADTDSTHKTLVWNLSQNVDRTTGSGAAGICPCLTPSMVPFVTNRGGPLVGIEALSLQGIPVDDLLLTRETENQMSDLAGNAMTTTVVGACMLSALMLMKDQIVAYSKVVEKGVAAENAKRERTVGSVGKPAAGLTVGGAAYAVAAESRVAGVADLADGGLHLCSVVPADDRKSHQKLLGDANAAARMCVCEAQTGIAANIQRCVDCGHTACVKCCGRPEHNYAPDATPRKEPNDFADTLKKALPMRVKLDGIDVARALKQGRALAGKRDLFGSDSVEDGSREETWAQWEKALAAVEKAEFLFRDVRRADVWIARYASPGADEVVLELRLGSVEAQPEWRVIVHPAPESETAPHEVFSFPVARMRVNPGAKHLLEGDWSILVPVKHSFDVVIKGQGELVESWQENLGMTVPTEAIEARPKDMCSWTKTRFSEYKVSYGGSKGSEDAFLDANIEGTYKLFEKCGAAQASLHKRVGDKGKLNKSAEMYFFLDPVRNSKGADDYFVFADNKRRLQYGEHRLHTARVEPRFRPKDSNADGVTYACQTDGQWMKMDGVRLDERRPVATLAVPKNIASLGAKSGGCANAVAIMKARVPLPAADAEAWPEGDFVTLRNDRSHSTFSRLAWFTSRLDLPEGVQRFSPLDNGDSSAAKHLCDTACPRCAPQPPKLEWVRRAGEKKLEAREDPREAATFEQSLKRRPAPFVVQWRKQSAKVTSPSKKGKGAVDDAVGDLVIAVNPATLVHRALANVTGGVARERSAARLYDEKKSTPEMEWQVVRHLEMDTAAPLEPFALKSNRADPYAKQPPGWNVEKVPLRPEQLRSLHWMLERERETQEPFVEEEVAEAVLPTLGLRMDGRARVRRLVRGGIIADQVGYGKTAITIGAIMANEIQWPTKAYEKASAAGKAPATRAIPTKATLVLAPSQLLRQWPREVEKFSKKGALKTVVIRTVADITHLTVAEVQEADVVICATSVLRSPLYFERLACLAGVPSLPHCKATGAGRHFANSYRDALGALETQVETLTGPGGAAAASERVRKGSGARIDVNVTAPKRLKGAKLVQATANVAGGKEGFKHVVAALEGKADAKQPAATPTKKAKSPAAKSPGAFKRTKPKASPAPPKRQTPTKKPATPKKPAAAFEASPATSPRARDTPRRRASLAVKYVDDSDEDADEDDSEYEAAEVSDSDDAFSDDEEDRRKAAARARAAKSKTRAKVVSTPGGGGAEDETEEPGDKDHWGFDTREVRADWGEATSCPLEAFHWRRVVVDEFTYLKQSDRCVVLGLQSESRWVLSGTPPVGAFAEIKDTAALLGTNLGSDEQPRFTKAEITKAETFQFYKEKATQHWHANRHAVAQGFLDRFVRQNIAEIDEIRSEEIPVEVPLRPAERAIYLELDHYLQAMDMKARQQKRGGNKGDRDKRLAVVLQGSATAEEALIKRCAKFELDDDRGHAMRTCQDIIDVRETQFQECVRMLREKILDCRYFFKEFEDTAECLGVEVWSDEERREDNAFIKWESIVRNEGVGDPDASALARTLLDEASWAEAEQHKPRKVVPAVGSVISMFLDDAWRTGTVLEIKGQHKAQVVCRWRDAEYVPKKSLPIVLDDGAVDVKKLDPSKLKVVQDGGVVAQMRREREALAAAAAALAGGGATKKGAKGAKKALATPTATPQGTPRKKAAAAPSPGVLGSAAPTPAAKEKAAGTPGRAKKLEGELSDKKWHIREEVREVRMLARELAGRMRSLRFFRSVRDLQRLSSHEEVACQACDAKSGGAGAPTTAKGPGGKKRPAATSSHPKSRSGLLSTCGHVGCLECLRQNAELQECGVAGCACPARHSSVVDATSLGTEAAAPGSVTTPKSPAKRAKGPATRPSGDGGPTDEALEMGAHGSKMAHLVQRLRDTPRDERVLVFVQFPDLMKQVADVLAEAGIKSLKLKGSVHQQTGALDEFQKEELGPKDARVLLLLSRDESASGANLTSANHAIFVHPLLTNSQYEYEASETQAIGRIRRYGQTKLVKVWRMLVKDSIDTEIYKQRTEAMKTVTA